MSVRETSNAISLFPRNCHGSAADKTQTIIWLLVATPRDIHHGSNCQWWKPKYVVVVVAWLPHLTLTGPRALDDIHPQATLPHPTVRRTSPDASVRVLLTLIPRQLACISTSSLEIAQAQHIRFIVSTSLYQLLYT
jgi:hypothetical protein